MPQNLPAPFDQVELKPGAVYIFHTRSITLPCGSIIPGEARTRTYLGLKQVGHVGLSKFPFLEVARADGAPHLLAMENVEAVTPA